MHDARVRAQVLRQHRETLMTCAETFLYDPLVDWTKAKGSAAGGGGAGGGAAGDAELENPQVRRKGPSF
jgi:phosphatidylinositol kinase/protein kinase (PI-3  family)